MMSKEWYHWYAVIIVQLHMCSYMAYTHFCESVAATATQELSTHISGTTDEIHL
jgi:hypothetical protein